MKNLTNQTNVSLPTWSVPHAVVFEVAIVITSALVIITSCLVIKYVYLKERRSRTDLLFAITSISDIGVGLLTIPSSGVDVGCRTFVKCSDSIFYFVNAFFPFIFLSHYNSYRNRQTTSHNEALPVQNDCYNTKIEDYCGTLIFSQCWTYFFCSLRLNVS